MDPVLAVAEPFSRVIIDWVGPLHQTKYVNCYLLTNLLRKVSSQTIMKALIKVLNQFRIPGDIQSKVSLFQRIMNQPGIKHITHVRLQRITLSPKMPRLNIIRTRKI